MAIKEERKFEEEKKNGMTIVTNMNGEKRANEKLEAKYKPGITSKELNELPGDTIQEKIEKKLGIKVMPTITLEKAIELLNKNKDKDS
jgi:hypothetical protein|tara:strand:- start:291 stop:554 length:264 start_codon:yes stop_codon:yes gene_type:complete